MITTLLFDLDGTLLPMNNDEFTKGYFQLLANKMIPLGYEEEALVNGIWGGTAAMIQNDGSTSNMNRFWDKFSQIFGERVLEQQEIFMDFYRNEFQKAKKFCGFDPRAKQVIELAKEKGVQVILATNPIFPAIATESRIRWAGLEPEDFLFYTTYENIGFCKPNLLYYQDIINRIDTKPEECMMVGNDVDEDMIAETLGMQVFLLENNVINRKNKDISCYQRGGFDELLFAIQNLN